MITQGVPTGSGSANDFFWWLTQGGGSSPSGGSGDSGGGGAGEQMPSGAAEWWALQGGDGGYPGNTGYYGTGGGVGYIHGTPEDEIRAWNLFLEMKRNGWDPYAPGSIEEARRGMGEFTQEEFDRYYEDFLKKQQPNISTNDFEPGENPPGEFDEGVNPPLQYGKWNDWLVSLLGKGKLGKLGLGKWIKGKQGEATFDDWMSSLQDDQRVWLDQWIRGLGADKNWEDRLRAGDAPWSRGQEAIDQTSRQNPNAPDLVNNEDDPRIGSGKRNPPDKPGGGGDEPEGSYDGPFGLPAYAGMAFNPSFLAYQPYNTNGPVQFVPGRK